MESEWGKQIPPPRRLQQQLRHHDDPTSTTYTRPDMNRQTTDALLSLLSALLNQLTERGVLCVPTTPVYRAPFTTERHRDNTRGVSHFFRAVVQLVRSATNHIDDSFKQVEGSSSTRQCELPQAGFPMGSIFYFRRRRFPFFSDPPVTHVLDCSLEK